MARVTLVDYPEQEVSCEPLEWGKGIQEILYFPAINPELGDDENSNTTIQEVWVFENKRLEKFLTETEKYDKAAQGLADAKLKLADAKSPADIAAAQSEVVAAQDQMRATLAEGYGKKRDDSVMPIPHGSSKKLVECIGLINKRTFYIATHDLKKVKDLKGAGKRKFRFALDTEATSRQMYEAFKEVATDSTDGTTDEKLKASKSDQKSGAKGSKKQYIDPEWKKKFFKGIRSQIAAEWKFGTYETEGQLKVSKIKRLVQNDLIRDFLLTEENCEIIDSFVGYLNDTAHFTYQQKEQKLDSLKTLLLKPDETFDHYDWGQVLLGVQQIWNATDRDFIDQIEERFEAFPSKLADREEIVNTLYAHKLPRIYMDASGGAQFMRYSANCGGIAKFDLNSAKLGYKADAKFSLLEAGVESNFYWPDNLGQKLSFKAPILEECFETQKLAESGKGRNNTDPTFAHNSSFLLPGAVIDTSEQLSGLMMTKQHSEQQELLIQVVGHTDTSGTKAYNTQMGYLRANTTQAFFTADNAQWKEYFDKGIWGDEERDMIYLSVYMMKNHPATFKERFAELGIGDRAKLRDILLNELQVAVRQHDYPVNTIRTQDIRKKLSKNSTGNILLEGGLSGQIDMPVSSSLPKDQQLIEVYFTEMQAYALQQIGGLDKEAFELFYIDTELHPILSTGETQIKVATGDEEKKAANRRVSLIPWGVRKEYQENTTEINLGEGRLHIHGQITAGVGATIGMAANFELNTYNGAAQLIAKKKKEDKVARYNGKEVQPTPDLGKQNATAKANARAFVGAEAEAAISAALEWKNPSETSQGFGILASIGGSLTGTAGAGIEGEFKIGFDQTTSTFQIKMKAVATWGIGGGGAWSFSVGVQRLFDFIKLVYYKLEENHFNFLDIFEDKFDSTGKATESETNVYEMYIEWIGSLWEEKKYIQAGVAASAGINLVSAFKVLQAVSDVLTENKRVEMEQKNAENLVDNIHANPKVLHFVPPEAKASMLFKITTFKSQSWGEFFSRDHYRRAEEAALHIIKGISHWREWQETMERLASYKNGRYIPFEHTKSDQNDRIVRMNRNVRYLRNELLNDTEDWEKVRTQISGLEHKDKAWNIKAMKWNVNK